MKRIQFSILALIFSFLTFSTTSATATTPDQVGLEPAPFIEGYTGYEHANCAGADGTTFGNVFGTPEQCTDLCTQFGDECAGVVIAAGKAPGVKELEEGALESKSWPWGSCYLRAGPAPMTVVDWPLDCMIKNSDGSYTKYEEQNCWGKESDIFRGTAYGGAPFGSDLSAAPQDGDTRENRRDRKDRKRRKHRDDDDDSDDDSDGDSDRAANGVVSPILYPWAKPTPEAESEALCQEFCDTLGPQCTAVMRIPADGQCYFRSAAGVQPLVDWNVRCYLKN